MRTTDFSCENMLLSKTRTPQAQFLPGAHVRTHVWSDLMDQIYDIICMRCGRAVGQLHQHKLYRDRSAQSMRKEGKRAICGFCGGSLFVQPDETGMLRYQEHRVGGHQGLRAS